MPPSTVAGFPCPEPPSPHNFGRHCRLAPVRNPFANDTVPPIGAQFFYSSPIPIDDPLAAIAATNDPRSLRATLQPFSPGDNNALESAWLGLAADQYSRNHDHARRQRSPSPSLARENAAKLAAITHDLAARHTEKHAREGIKRDSMIALDGTAHALDDNIPLCCPDLLVDVHLALRNSFCVVARRRQRMLHPEKIAQNILSEMQSMRVESSGTITEQRGRSNTAPSASLVSEQIGLMHELPGSTHSFSKPSSFEEGSSSRIQPRNTGSRPNERKPIAIIPAKSSLVDDGITGKPFIRVGTPETATFSQPSSVSKTNPLSPTPTQPKPKVVNILPSERIQSSQATDLQLGKGSTSVLVGVSRLHEVTLPALQMKPIYWSPVNDIATVLRATWFYRDDMRPIDPSVANQLEAGYRELKPHTETWNDELRCAVEVGPLGEEKVSHPLWPKTPESSNKRGDDMVDPILSSDPFCAARCFHGEAAAEGTLIPSANEDNSSPLQTHKKFEQYHVIYKDERNAFLLKPSLKPSAYYGRRPVAKIVRGMTIGIPVVRGFDYKMWKAKHQKTKSQQQNASRAPSFPSHSNGRDRNEQCLACKAEKDRSQVTDLVLVVHGIGQKLAERVENYHFTHAINAFRRAINVELNNDAVRAVLREGQNGIMVLPINWRQDLSFEDGGPMREEDKAHYAVEAFGLKDIEPKTIPAVRSMISDVMFDIPFYMSQHKPKMVAAMVKEANRVYRLWCRNNPGFSEKGRVHIIGHSLGTVMSVEVLSRQPTSIPNLQLNKPLQTQHFEFDTKNLFLLGSPVAFFLLLERGALLPRRGRLKPGADPTDVKSSDVVGDVETFGCLAVDNIYNILAREDPVGYLLNGTVDPMFAASLKTAYVPSASPSFLQSMGSAMRGFVPGVSTISTSTTDPALTKPPTMRLPSQLELEVHDFTREEIAERKALLLNDNGQIDYFLRSGGGPLELQYLNMLSAHTSYWVNHDLMRMLCQEIGRKPGRENTLPALRAVKAAKRAIASTV
ncbi:DDHD domain-containing protein [Xylaria bambusicola]|uniref:DDHD domain-containing protein n=1 Tax=Xylaria bambusicola TaxID=326684 RepID=UPI002008D5AA|nr:DDHD domain-containing protein [Xylaria bambusicola]KAI0518572.1 DDHD domain-containing protein [Xylaria bambusicola]